MTTTRTELAGRVAETLGFALTGEHETEWGTDIVYRVTS
jgi:hypothetical protein